MDTIDLACPEISGKINIVALLESITLQLKNQIKVEQQEEQFEEVKEEEADPFAEMMPEELFDPANNILPEPAVIRPADQLPVAEPLNENAEDEIPLNLEEFFELEVKLVADCRCGKEVEQQPGDSQFCPRCDNSFCRLCKVLPYHQDMSCEQYQFSLGNYHCRFCDEKLLYPSGVQGIAFKYVCTKLECIERCNIYCCKNLACDHPCLGFKNEGACYTPCLHPDCVKENPDKTFGVDWNSTCSICMEPFKTVDALLTNQCKHIFHSECIKQRMMTRWEPGTPVQINFNQCPCCNAELKFQLYPIAFQQIIEDARVIVGTVKKMALHFAKIEGLDKDERLTREGDPFFGKLEELAVSKIAFYECFKCKIPYFGGMKDCAEAIRQLEEEKRQDPSELVCPNCVACGEGAGRTTCDKHGVSNILWKCRHCCEQAVWFCWGTTHFCEPCHEYGGQGGDKQCNPETCPQMGCHPPPGTEFALGCGMCKNGFDAFSEDMLKELAEQYEEQVLNA